LEDSLLALRSAKPVTMLYDTTFLIAWPQHLGGGEVELTLHGSLTLIPMMGIS
jgi:hypothetical protein